MLNAMQQMNVLMTGTTAKAQLVEILLEPLKGCKGLYRYRQDLVKKVMAMPDLQVREYLDYQRRLHHSG